MGGLARHLAALRTHAGYERLAGWGGQALHGAGAPARAPHRTLHAAKEGIKEGLKAGLAGGSAEAVMPHSLFCELGLHYLGPVDGHDITALEAALERAKTHVAQGLQEAGIRTPVRAVGVADGFPRQATRAEILAAAGLTAQAIAHTVTQTLARAAVTAVPTGPRTVPAPKRQ